MKSKLDEMFSNLGKLCNVTTESIDFFIIIIC